MLSFLYVYSDHSILECYNLFSGVELSVRSVFVISECGRECPETGDRGPTRHVGAGRWGLLLADRSRVARATTPGPPPQPHGWLRLGLGGSRFPDSWRGGGRHVPTSPGCGVSGL